VFGSGDDLYWQEASGGRAAELLLHSANRKTVSDWSRDGKYLVYTEIDPRSRSDIWYLSNPSWKSQENKPEPFLQTGFDESQGQLSPDTHWIAYTSDETGRSEVYVRPFPGGPGKWKISADGGLEPRWRRDGKEIFYIDPATYPREKLMAAAVQASSGGLTIASPRLLFEFRSPLTVPLVNVFAYSPAADGQRFLATVLSGTEAATLNVITNWEKAASSAAKEP
jgi:Tol biopolymer transport system component